MTKTKYHLTVTICLVFVVLIVAGKGIGADNILKMSTTTSTQSSGLLDMLLPELEKDTGIRVMVIAKGTGAAIRDGRDGNVDVIFVHAKSLEELFIRDGYGTKRYAVMHNDFVILGPKNDPAGIKGIRHAVSAFRKIARAKVMFVSRGDDSGTHTKEQALWEETGLNMIKKATVIRREGKTGAIGFFHPEGLGDWYLSIGQGMGKTITFAEEKQAYTFADRGTFIKYKYGRKGGLDLAVLTEGDPDLVNPYGVIPVNPAIHPHVKYELAKRFAEWLVSKKGQRLIGNYKLHGKALFYPDAVLH